MSEVPPILLSSIICEKVIFDRITGSPTIVSIIQQVGAPKYPVRYAQLVFFCEMTNGHGKTAMKIRLVDVEAEEKVIFEQGGVVEFKDVKQIVTLALNLQGVVLPRPGEYRFQLFCEEHLLGERRIVCRKIDLRRRGEQSGGRATGGS